MHVLHLAIQEYEGTFKSKDKEGSRELHLPIKSAIQTTITGGLAAAVAFGLARILT